VQADIFNTGEVRMVKCPLCKHGYWLSARKQGTVQFNYGECRAYIGVCPNCNDEYFLLNEMVW